MHFGRGEAKAAGMVLAESIRNYVREQRKLWKTVPYLALEADGRKNFSGIKESAYELGCYPVQCTFYTVSEYDGWAVYIDLATGELVDGRKLQDNEIVSASDEDVIRIAFFMDDVDARRLVWNLREQADPFLHPDPPAHEDWRKPIREKLDLHSIFVRHGVSHAAMDSEIG